MLLKKPRILVVGSFMMDLIASAKRAPKSGETVVGDSFRTAPGGKGANQAVQCARLGAYVTMVGRVGKESFGRELVEAAAAAGVDVTHVTVDPNVTSGVGNVLLEVSDVDTQNRITVVPGANFTLTVGDVAWLKTEIQNYDMVMMQFELPMEVVEAVAGWAYDAGVEVMINPAPAAPVSEFLLARTTYLSPNEHEASALTNHPIEVESDRWKKDVEIVAQNLRQKGVKNLIITLGKNGSAAADAEGVIYVPCVPISPVIDPTAAGDSFVASFCTGLTAGMGRSEALHFASHAAAITVSRMGAMPSLPTVDEVQQLMRDYEFSGFDPVLLDALK